MAPDSDAPEPDDPDGSDEAGREAEVRRIWEAWAAGELPLEDALFAIGDILDRPKE
jgi:hypothetical protein